MQLSDSQTALEAGQLVIAGLTLGLAVDQALAWWRERSPSLRWMALTSFALVAVLAANVAVVAATRGSIADAALFARAVALSVATVFVVIMASSVGGRKTPHWVLALVLGLATCRVMLWVGTDLMFAHRWLHGVPVYGPLLVVVNVPLLALSFGYLLVAVMRGGSKREHIALVAGASMSLVVAAVSMAVRENPTAELLTGFTVVPLALSGLAVLAIRTAQSSTTVIVQVEDTGPSVTEEAMAQLFDPFVAIREGEDRQSISRLVDQ